MSESLVKLAQELQDCMERNQGLCLMVENGKGLDELYVLRSVVSDCIVAIELKEGRIP